MLRFALAILGLLLCLLGQPIKGYARSPSDTPPKLHVCTVASKKTQGLQQLLHSCERHGITIDILGMDLPYHGNSHKLLYVQEYLKDLPPKDLILFVDAYDVLLMSDAETIRNKFLNMNVPFLISAETNCFPHRRLAKRFPRGPSSFRYTNSGSYIGYVHALQEILNDISPIPFWTSDQGLFMTHYFQYPGKQTLDVHCELFLTLFGLKEQDVHIDPITHVITCMETGTTPCLVHGNGDGDGKLLYQLIYDYLFAGGRPLKS